MGVFVAILDDSPQFRVFAFGLENWDLFTVTVLQSQCGRELLVEIDIIPFFIVVVHKIGVLLDRVESHLQKISNHLQRPILLLLNLEKSRETQTYGFNFKTYENK